ncbi:hypothetical protein ACODT5_46905 [Streptomyces sp. 5.8]|uniref:hypothetical protein n=1 Tax=Streptomyces sp. 5.8 TaxID=3406571 RepID=UPI003BB7E68A
MTTQICEKDGVHQLPEDEDSWHSERCDRLVAAGLDRCLPCQDRLITEVSVTLTDDFGRLFTTWVIGTLNRWVTLGASIPDTALELFGPNGGPAISPPSRKALRRVKLPRVPGAGPEAAAFSLDAKGATTVLTAMKPGEREAVLNDAMDGIVASIAIPLPPVS